MSIYFYNKKILTKNTDLMFYLTLYFCRVTIRRQMKKRDVPCIPIHRCLENKCIMVGNNLLYTWHTECHCSFSSSQMASIKTYLTAVYHGQLHFRCKWGLLSIIHRHHYAWHTVWHLTQVVTAKRHQWLVTGLHMWDADITTYAHLSFILITHAVQNSS